MPLTPDISSATAMKPRTSTISIVFMKTLHLENSGRIAYKKSATDIFYLSYTQCSKAILYYLYTHRLVVVIIIIIERARILSVT